MVQHAGADDLVEDLSETPDVFDRKPAEIEVPEAVFSLKIAGVAEAGFADVDRGRYARQARASREWRPGTCRSRRPGSCDSAPAVASAKGEATPRGGDPDCDRARDAGRGWRAAPDTDGSRKRRALRRPDRQAVTCSPPPKPLASASKRPERPRMAVRSGRYHAAVSSVHPGRGLVHRLQRVVEREGVGFLDRREVLEGRRPLRRRRLRAVDHVDAVE